MNNTNINEITQLIRNKINDMQNVILTDQITTYEKQYKQHHANPIPEALKQNWLHDVTIEFNSSVNNRILKTVENLITPKYQRQLLSADVLNQDEKLNELFLELNQQIFTKDYFQSIKSVIEDSFQKTSENFNSQNS